MNSSSYLDKNAHMLNKILSVITEKYVLKYVEIYI